MRPVTDWTEEDLRALVATGEPESSSLEYKASAALHANCRAEVSKDVSGMANAAGGLIVYGIREENHLPVSIDEGVADPKFDREWLESVIGSNIRPKIPNVTIKAIRLVSGRECFAVSVPQSTTMAPHQAQDGRYYRRRNFRVEPMEDAEIRDVMRRSDEVKPVLQFELHNLQDNGEDGVAMSVLVRATALTAVPILYSFISMAFDADLFNGNIPPAPANFNQQDGFLLTGDHSIPCKNFSMNMMVPGHMPLFLGQRWNMGSLDIILKENMWYPVYYKIACPGCVTEGNFNLVLENRQPKLGRVTDVDVRWRDIPLEVGQAARMAAAVYDAGA